MPSFTEIYLCKEGQQLREGKLETWHSVMDKDEAERDAIRRCRHDSSIRRIAYYAVHGDGGFKTILIYNAEKVASPLNARRRVVRRR